MAAMATSERPNPVRNWSGYDRRTCQSRRPMAATARARRRHGDGGLTACSRCDQEVAETAAGRLQLGLRAAEADGAVDDGDDPIAPERHLVEAVARQQH